MKKLSLFVVIIMMLCMSCTKHIPYIQEPNKVNITFNVSNKTHISPDGTVQWLEGDIIHVYHSKDGYLGNTVNNGNAFTGNINAWSNSGEMRFIYIGDNTLSSSNTVEISFINQENTDLTDIASKYHVSICKIYVTDEIVNTFCGSMDNVTALGCFDLSDFTESKVKMYSADNLYNKLTIGSKGDITCGVAGAESSGHIMLDNSSLKYVALLPQDENTPTDVQLMFTTQHSEGSDIVRTIYPSGYLNNKQPIIIQSNAIEDDFDDLPNPSGTHVFTVYSKDGSTKKVVFARGNLVYDKGRFKIHKEQYNTLSTNDISVDGTFDNFCWATSGWSNGNTYYQPYANTHTNASNKGYGYGPYNGKSYAQSIHPDTKGTNPYRFSDWGRYRFDMDTYGQTSDGRYWRLMGDGEWATLFARKDFQNRYLWGYANVCNVKGCVLLPDDWSEDVEFTYGSTNFTSNILNKNEWDDMEDAGAVFLPFNGEEGRYWGAKHSNSDKAGCFVMNTKQHSISATLRYERCYVRLVYQVQGSIWK